MYDAEEEAWKELARRKEKQRLDEAFERFMHEHKPEASPAVIKAAFQAGWEAAKE